MSSTTGNENRAPKRPKRSVEDDLICPITLELPFDPVTAEDGFVYERSAIEKYFNTKKDDTFVPSPSNKVMIGKKLTTAVNTKNTIETLIESNVIKGQLAESWKAKAKQKIEMDVLVKQAEDGDVNSMIRVARNYYAGLHGFPTDNEKAFVFFEKAHKKGDIRATGWMAIMLLHRKGKATNKFQGIMYLTMAATRGSCFAASHLGLALAVGHYGLRPNKEEAISWLELALSSDTNDISPSLKICVTQKLAELEAES